MVGRNKRTHTVAKKEAEVVSEEEIVCLDVPTKNNRKSKTVRNFKVKKTEKKSQEENTFAGFDEDGVSAEEKQQIREAILASEKEQEELKCADTSQKPETPNSTDGELSTDTSKLEECTSEANSTTRESSIQDNDETQPPSESDIEEIEFGLNLDQSTLEVSRDDIFDTDSTAKEDTDTTLRDDDIYKIDIEDVEIVTKACDDKQSRNRDLKKSKLAVNDHKNEGDITMSDTVTDSTTIGQLNESGDSQGFDPDMQMDVEKENQTIVGEDNLLEHSETKPRTRRSVSKESVHQKDLSQDQEKNSSQKHSSQGSMDSEKNALRSSGPQKTSETSEKQSSMSNSQEKEIRWEHVPLIRNYKSTKPETVQHGQYFRTSETEELEKSAMAIYQLFEIYRTKLHVAQRKLREKVTWAEPIKSGQHQSRTIDVKKRGKESFYMELSDDDEGSQDKKLYTATKLQRNPNSKDDNNSDDLPELVIENETGWESLGKLGRKPLGTKGIDKEIMSVDTQPYDIDDNDDEDFVVEEKTRRGRGRPKAGAGKDNLKSKVNVGNDKEHDERPTRGRLGRKLGLNGGKSDTKVLVEDTQQEEMDLQEAVRRSKSDSQRSVQETQIKDDDFDWLNVNNIRGKEEFENQMHKAKLKGYSIPKVAQKHSKDHQKIVNPEQRNEDENLEDVEHITLTKSDCPDEMTEDVVESKPSTRGRKRKAKKQGVTLVEDTQDQDAEESGLNRLRGKTKRNCFKLDSESEEESIAESQDIDGPSYNDLDDKKQSNKGNNNTGTEKKDKSFMSSVFEKVKNFVSPSKNKQSGENDDEGSQSPIISRKKYYNSASKKVYSKPSDQNDAEYETDAFKEYKAKSAEKKYKNVNTTNTRKGRVLMPATENDLIEENGIPEGVKRFISRPSSKDSNASDTFSTTSSQMSTNILDEKGDLYSTQYCEIKTRKGKDLRPKVNPKQEHKKEVEEILLLDDSDEDIHVIKEPKKTYSVKNSNKKVPIIRGARVVGKTNQQVKKNENIRQYFSEAKKHDDVDAAIELDLDVIEPEQKQKDRKVIEGNVNDEDDIVAGKSGKNKEHNQSSVKACIISVPDTATEYEVEKVKADINHFPFKFDLDTSPKLKKKENISKVKRHGEANSLHHLDIESDNPPIMLNGLNSARGDKIHGLDHNNRGVRPKTRNIETDTDMFEPRPTNRRRRKVSETITTADLEGGRNESTRNRHARDQDLENYLESGHLRNGSRKRVGEHNIDEEDHHVKKKVERVECPMCGRSFPASVIEQHAATCEGHVESEEDTDVMNEKEYIAHMAEHFPHMSQQELVEHLSQRHQHVIHGDMHEHLSQQEHMEAHIHLHDADHHLNHMEGHHGHPGVHEHLHDSDVAVNHFIHHDEHVKDVAKHISCSPGEEGEVEACYICDAQVPKGKPYEIHLNRCLAMAAQQQAEVDKKGYDQVFVEPEVEEEVQVRILRGRQVAHEGSNTPSRGGVSRAGLYTDDSPSRRRQKRELGFQNPSSGDERGRLSDPEDLENRTGAAKRLTKGGNRNKAALNDDGSGHITRN